MPATLLPPLAQDDALFVVRHADEGHGLVLEVLGAVDVLVEPIVGRELAGLGCGKRVLHRVAYVLFDLLDLVRGGQVEIQQQLLHVLDGISGLAHAAHFLPRAVGRARVRHGVPVVAVGVELHVDRTLSSRDRVGSADWKRGREEEIAD